MSDRNNPPRPTATLSEKLRAAPLLRALVPMAAGILLGTFVTCPLYVWVTAVAICAATAWLALFRIEHSRRRTAFSTLYIALALLFFGAALARAHTPQPIVPRGERVWLEMLVTDNPAYRDDRRSAAADGVVIRWQPDNPTAATPTGEWRSARERMLLSFDTMWRFEAGDRVVFRGYVNPIDTAASSYTRLMAARGYTGRTYVSQYSRPTIAQARSKSLAIRAKKLQFTASERLRRLSGSHNVLSRMPLFSADRDAIAVATAMTTGDRSGITPELRAAYSRTGAMHVLSVSGLHVGIVFLIINTLLYLLPFFPRGHIVKNLAAVAAIWFYAALTGLSPSATRSAFMFTGAQIALATSQTRGATNIMCGTALLMLAVRPGLLFDISFQLSFIAVAAIMSWFTPIYRLVESRFGLLNALWGTLIIGLVASLATLPLVSHAFGVFSLAGIALNPVIVITSHLILVFSLIRIAAPLPFLEPLFSLLVGVPARLQNRAVELVSAVPGAAIEWSMPSWLVFVIYAAMIIFTVWLSARPRKTEPFILPR